MGGKGTPWIRYWHNILCIWKDIVIPTVTVITHSFN